MSNLKLQFSIVLGSAIGQILCAATFSDLETASAIMFGVFIATGLNLYLGGKNRRV